MICKIRVLLKHVIIYRFNSLNLQSELSCYFLIPNLQLQKEVHISLACHLICDLNDYAIAVF